MGARTVCCIARAALSEWITSEAGGWMESEKVGDNFEWIA